MLKDITDPHLLHMSLWKTSIQKQKLEIDPLHQMEVGIPENHTLRMMCTKIGIQKGLTEVEMMVLMCWETSVMKGLDIMVQNLQTATMKHETEDCILNQNQIGIAEV